MLMTEGSIIKCFSYFDSHSIPKFRHLEIANISPLLNVIGHPGQPSASCSESFQHKCFLSTHGHGRLKGHVLSRDTVNRRWLCQSQDPVSSDDEYRSSTNIAISLIKRYRNVIDRGGTDNLKEFIRAGVNAYALGCTDEGLRKELTYIKESGVEIEAMEIYGGSTSLKSIILSNEVDECILWLSIIFITILCTPQPTVVRWSTSPPVSEDILGQWKGFCAIIAKAYYIRGMACEASSTRADGGCRACRGTFCCC
ncbi:hypothetical protein RND81_07G121900 [Saponaria officinalis]|uniref:DUF7876 domain-containing protein n=1 Tax=Saponaria officinalis TaxID=3572 RepID=A0AAW1JS53_SAPOF